MNEADLEVVDGLTLSAEHRALLRPGEPIAGENGKVHYLPRFFYSVPSWAAAREIRCAPHFKLAELMSVDCREAALLLDIFPALCPVRGDFACWLSRGLPPRRRRGRVCQREWRLSLARAPA